VIDKLSQTEGTREAPVEQGVGGVSLSQQEDEA
jgi:hypothetical protein